MLCTQKEWVDALTFVLKTLQESGIKTSYSLEGLSQHHGCPPPLDRAGKTAVLWSDTPILWSYPGDYLARTVDVDVSKDTVFPTACMGTMFWFVAQAMQYLSLESSVSADDWRVFKTRSMREPKDGFAQAAVDLKWASKIITDPREFQVGDLVGIRKGGEIHHWCIAWEPLIVKHTYRKKERDVLWTLGSSPDAGGVGVDWYSLESPGRDFVGAAMFR